ncbi:hypothetical protein Tco_1260760 [Tanacetum coccineum]
MLVLSSKSYAILKSTTRHVFYFGTSPITWSSQKQNTVVLSLYEAKVMADTAALSSNLAKRGIGKSDGE